MPCEQCSCLRCREHRARKKKKLTQKEIDRDARFKVAFDRLLKKSQPIFDEIERSQRITGEDLSIIVR